MKNIWLMATTTWRRRVRSGTFLVMTFGLPVLMVIAGVIGFMMETGGDLSRVGYVDQSGQLAPVEAVPVEGDTLRLTRYADVEAARAAYQDGAITGYLVVPPDYVQGGAATFYAQDQPGAVMNEALAAFMRRALRPDAPDWAWDRLTDPTTVTYVAQDSGVEIIEGPAILARMLFPLILAAMFTLAVLSGASQMGAAIVREKDQRAMEMIITSMSPRELVAGKVLGMTLLSLTQFAIWALGAGIAAVLALSGTLDLQEVHVPWQALIWALLLCVPGYFLYAMLASGLGIIAGDNQQARQLAGVLGMLGVAPLWFMGVLVEAPDGSLAVALTLFPLTSPTVSLVRMALTQVPLWQLLASLTIILLCLVGSVWFVARIFRTVMLMYGQSLRPRQLWRALRQA